MLASAKQIIPLFMLEVQFILMKIMVSAEAEKNIQKINQPILLILKLVNLVLGKIVPSVLL